MRHRSLSHSTQGVGVQGLLGGQDCHVLDTAGPSWPPPRVQLSSSHSGHALGTAGLREGSTAWWWRGKKWETALRAPREQGEQEIQLQEQGFLCSSHWKCGEASIPWQPVDRTTAEQIPPLQAVEGPQRNIFIPKDCSQWKGPMLEPGKGMRRKELGTGL